MYVYNIHQKSVGKVKDNVIASIKMFFFNNYKSSVEDIAPDYVVRMTWITPVMC